MPSDIHSTSILPTFTVKIWQRLDYIGYLHYIIKMYHLPIHTTDFLFSRLDYIGYLHYMEHTYNVIPSPFYKSVRQKLNVTLGQYSFMMKLWSFEDYPRLRHHKTVEFGCRGDRGGALTEYLETSQRPKTIH
jgi:hypothetical protein